MALRWRRRAVRRPDVDLAVLELGDPGAPTVILVHGWPDTHRLWLPLAEHLTRRSGLGLHLVAYDTRGQGASPTAAPDTAFALPHLAADLLAVLDAVSPDEPAHVVGHDWGSVQSWEAVCEPAAEDRMASFTSISGPNLDHVAAWVRDTVRHPTPRGIAAVLGQAVSSSYVPFLVSPLAPPLLGALGRRDMVSGLRYYRANMLHRLDAARERRTRVPVLQLALSRDPAIRDDALRASDPWCTDLRRHRLPLGHWAPRTSPAAVAEQVLALVTSVEGRHSTGRG